jgi:ribosomal protein S18 acetylase RimI-like enzyme
LHQKVVNSPAAGTAAWFDVAAIRDLTEDDWWLLRWIRLRALEDAPHAFTSEYDDEAARDEFGWRESLRVQLWLAAFLDEMTSLPVGVVAASFESPVPVGEPFISSLWVHPRHRRRGIARRLVHTASEHVAARGAEAISLWVLEGNEGAYGLYRALGFEPTGERQIAPGRAARHERRMRRTMRLARRPGRRAGT